MLLAVPSLRSVTLFSLNMRCDYRFSALRCLSLGGVLRLLFSLSVSSTKSI